MDSIYEAIFGRFIPSTRSLVFITDGDAGTRMTVEALVAITDAINEGRRNLPIVLKHDKANTSFAFNEQAIREAICGIPPEYVDDETKKSFETFIVTQSLNLQTIISYYPASKQFHVSDQTTFDRDELILLQGVASKVGNNYIRYVNKAGADCRIEFPEIDRALRASIKLDDAYNTIVEVQEKLEAGDAFLCSCADNEACSDCGLKDLSDLPAANESNFVTAYEEVIVDYKCTNDVQTSGRIFRTENQRAKLMEAIDRDLFIYHGIDNLFNPEFICGRAVDFCVDENNNFVVKIEPFGPKSHLEVQEGEGLRIFQYGTLTSMVDGTTTYDISSTNALVYTGPYDQPSDIDTVNVRAKLAAEVRRDAEDKFSGPVKVVDIDGNFNFVFAKK